MNANYYVLFLDERETIIPPSDGEILKRASIKEIRATDTCVDYWLLTSTDFYLRLLRDDAT